MGGRRRKKSSELRPLFSKGRPKPGKHSSSFSPIYEGPTSPKSPLSSTSHLARSREDVLFGSVTSLGLGRSRENMMSKSRENMSKSRESLSKSLRADSREDVSQSSLSEPVSKSLSKITFMNVTNKVLKLDTIEEPSSAKHNVASSLHVSETSTFASEFELELEIPLDFNFSQDSSNSSNNMLLTYAKTPPFMESSSSNSGKMGSTPVKPAAPKRVRSQLSTSGPSDAFSPPEQSSVLTEITESFQSTVTSRGSSAKTGSFGVDGTRKSPRGSIEKKGHDDCNNYIPTFANNWSSIAQSPTDTNFFNLSIDK